MNQQKPPKPPAQKWYERPSKKYQKKEYYQPPAATAEEIDFRHSHWKWKRKLVLEALLKTGHGQATIDSFNNCGGDCFVQYSKVEERYTLVGSFCHNRHCEPCMRQKANLMAANLRTKLDQNPHQHYRFITLTLRHTDTPLREQIDRLYQSFKKLRQTKLWKESQRGGAAIFEGKWNPDTGEWHPHLHVIAEGEFIRQKDLADAWHAITKDSHMVDIRLIGNTKDAVHYVSKYVGKGCNQETWINEGAAIEWICAMKGTRTCATYGTWRGFKLLAKPKDTTEWKTIGTLQSIICQANEGNPYYIRLLDTITSDLQYNPHKKRAKKTQSDTTGGGHKFLP